MRLAPIIVLAVLFGFLPGEDRGSSIMKAALPAFQEPAEAAETQPTTRKEPKGLSVDDEIKALNLKNMELKSAMKQMESLKLEPKLKDWSSSTSPDFAEARKTGVRLAGMAKVIDWKKSRKSKKDPKAFDQFASDLESAGRKMAEAAAKKDATDLQSAANAAQKSCSDCHNKFNG